MIDETIIRTINSDYVIVRFENINDARRCLELAEWARDVAYPALEHGHSEKDYEPECPLCDAFLKYPSQKLPKAEE